ncbi:hypothetical protein [Microtetraspora fusca]|uniref:hypothetical protein n=1 Tax=Microtetraspora fusca TaxID=1997 RepID=UPI00082DBA29|nr:hypothetical protein [Microtetraspora fusca]
MTLLAEKVNADPAFDAISIHSTYPVHTSVEVPVLCVTATMGAASGLSTANVGAVNGGTVLTIA